MEQQIGDIARSAKDYAEAKARSVKDTLLEKDRVDPGERSEGTITKQIEAVTSTIPSGAFLSFAIGSMILSAGLQLLGRKNESNFVGQWAPTILIMGLYNKLVKLEGSDTAAA